jgi:hypothetical protein
MNDVTRLLSAIEHGDPQAAEALLPLVYQELRKSAPNNVAKSSLIPDSVISRTRLRPKYGQGWQPLLDPRPRQADGRDPGEEEST